MLQSPEVLLTSRNAAENYACDSGKRRKDGREAALHNFGIDIQVTKRFSWMTVLLSENVNSFTCGLLGFT